MIVVEVILGVLGSVAAIVLLASLLMAVMGFIATIAGSTLRRCSNCGRLYLSSEHGPEHECHDHLAAFHDWHDHHPVLLHHRH